MNDLYYPLFGSTCFGLSPVNHQEHHLINCITHWYVRAGDSSCCISLVYLHRYLCLELRHARTETSYVFKRLPCVSPLVTIMRANKVQLQLVLLLLLYATSWIRCYICTTVQRTSVTLLSLTSNTLRQQNKFDLFPIFALLLHLFALPLWHCALFRNFRLCYRRDASSFQIPTKFHCDLL